MFVPIFLLSESINSLIFVCRVDIMYFMLNRTITWHRAPACYLLIINNINLHIKLLYIVYYIRSFIRLWTTASVHF